jgi:hypothetical protein
MFQLASLALLAPRRLCVSLCTVGQPDVEGWMAKCFVGGYEKEYNYGTQRCEREVHVPYTRIHYRTSKQNLSE